MPISKRHLAWVSATALALATTCLSVAPASAQQRVAALPMKTASLGPCWLSKLNIGLGEDTNAHVFVTRWYAGSTQTIISGTAPKAHYWALTLYHAKRGKMTSYYDTQLASAGSTFTLSIGGSKSSAKGIWVDPTTQGGDSEGYLFFRVYQTTGSMPTLPTVSYSGNVPSSASSCSSTLSDLNKALAAADKASGNGGGGGTQPTTVGGAKLWPNSTPYRSWSIAIDPAKSVPATDVTKASLLTQTADPNVIYHALFFNIAQGDLVMHGTLPPISTNAPRSGVRYVSICAYQTNQSRSPLACFNDSSLTVDKQGHYVIILSPDQQDPSAGNWLNPGDTAVGVIIFRWILPSKGDNSNYCLPSFAYRPSGDTTVPPLPSGC